MKLKRLSRLVSITLAAALLAFSLVGFTPKSASASSSSPTKYSLKFPVNDYTTVTKMVTTSEGQEEVTYHYYQDIVYVAHPVDVNYESMNVLVPTKVYDVTTEVYKDINAKHSPILFNINVGGYMSSSINGGSGGGPPGGGPPGGSGSSAGQLSLSDLALAAGYVVVNPACRGWDNEYSQAVDGVVYYGKAPADIVDLKSAVRYIRHNTGLIPGNTNWIIATGGSAGGALSTLLGASGNSRLYDPYFKELGAAGAPDNIYASCSFSPITDLNHADGAYEWEFGTVPVAAMAPGGPFTPPTPGLVNQTLSQELKQIFAKYEASLHLQGENGFGPITADNYAEYILHTYLYPSATKYLLSLTNTERDTYLSQHTWITWKNDEATFTWSDYVNYVGRMKGLPAFDSFTLSNPENKLFGSATTWARHFTNFSLRYVTGNPNAEISNSLKKIVDLMNPMYFIEHNNPGCCNYWWIRNGTIDNNTAHTVCINLATLLQNKGKSVNTWLYWDGGHAVDWDPEACIAWIGRITGHPPINHP